MKVNIPQYFPDTGEFQPVDLPVYPPNGCQDLNWMLQVIFARALSDNKKYNPECYEAEVAWMSCIVELDCSEIPSSETYCRWEEQMLTDACPYPET